MKLTKLLSILILGLGLCLASCTEPCDDVACENGGTCIDGTCDCPDGTLGTNCQSFDATKVQLLLDSGVRPIDLYDGGIPLSSLYGKTYEGGLIFYLNTNNGTGFVAAQVDQGVAVWGCAGVDIPGLNNVTELPPSSAGVETISGTRIGDGKANTDAILAACTGNDESARLCRDLGVDWFLPSRGELKLMYTNLHTNGHGNFSTDDNGGNSWYGYWSSTEYDISNAWIQRFDTNVSGHAWKLVAHVRAAKAF